MSAPSGSSAPRTSCSRRRRATGSRTERGHLALDEMERRHIERAIAAADGRVNDAAALLQIPRSTLYHKLKRYRLRSKNRIG